MIRNQTQFTALACCSFSSVFYPHFDPSLRLKFTGKQKAHGRDGDFENFKFPKTSVITYAHNIFM